VRGVQALINLAFKHDKNKSAIASRGGIERVVIAMSWHEENRRVQEAACGVLGNLAVSALSGEGFRQDR